MGMPQKVLIEEVLNYKTYEKFLHNFFYWWNPLSKKLKETDETSPIGGKSCGQKSECSYFYSGTISI